MLGVLIAALLPGNWGMLSRMLAGWNIAVWSYLFLMAILMTRASPARVRKIVGQEDESAVTVLTILSTAAIFSLIAITLELATLKDLPPILRVWRYAYTASTVMGSWFLVGTIFSFHYAHVYYRTPCAKPPLAFPEGETSPDFWDFLYFSFTISVAAQTSDVSILSRSVRKTVLAQSIISFLFNAAILGFSINIAASLVGI